MARFAIEPQTLDDVHQAVLDLTHVNVKRVENDGDLRRLSADLKKKLPVQLEFEFGRNTEALVIRELEADPRSPSFTAIVDARGERRCRAWFSERHEPIHVLLPDQCGKATWRRTSVERPEPVEQVIDAVAATVAFWEPIVRPALMAALVKCESMEAMALTELLNAPPVPELGGNVPSRLATVTALPTQYRMAG